MNDLIQYLRQYGRLTQEQCNAILAKAQPADVKKGAYFSEAGRVSRRIGFVTDGVFRVCYYDRHGADFTRYFIYEHRFVADMSSFMDELPSAEYIEAVTDAKVLEFSREDFTALAGDIPEWTDIFAKITSSVLENKMKAAYGAEFLSFAAQQFAQLVFLFGRERAAAYAGAIGLHDANDLADLLRGNA